MTTWILLFWIINGRGVAINSAEFTSKLTCEAAARELYRAETRFETYHAICTEK